MGGPVYGSSCATYAALPVRSIHIMFQLQQILDARERHDGPVARLCIVDKIVAVQDLEDFPDSFQSKDLWMDFHDDPVQWAEIEMTEKVQFATFNIRDENVDTVIANIL